MTEILIHWYADLSQSELATSLGLDGKTIRKYLAPAELVATGPGQVYTWKIIKLAGPARAIYYDAYVMIGIYSRSIVCVHVHPRESGPLAE